MKIRRTSTFYLLLVPFFLLISQWTYGADIPAAVQAAVSARTDESHKLQPPIIDAGSAMQGAYIYFVINMSDVPDYKKNDRSYILDAHLLFLDGDHIWHNEIFDRYVKEDGVPEVASVFFVNADRDPKDKEVVILVRTPLNHYDYGGEYFDGYIYRLTGNAREGAVFAGLQSDASAPFVGQCECGFRDGRSTHAQYKDADSIRKALARRYPVEPKLK